MKMRFAPFVLCVAGMLAVKVARALPAVDPTGRTHARGFPTMAGNWLLTWTDKSRPIEKILGKTFEAEISNDGHFTILTPPRTTTVTLLTSANVAFPTSHGWYQFHYIFGGLGFIRLNVDGHLEMHYFDESQKEICKTTYKSIENYCSGAVGTRKTKTGAPKPDCMVICGYNYEPTCGTDGKTYSNKCLLSAAIQCENKPDLAVKSEGPCPGLCAKALENAKPIPGGFLPSCKEDGSYDEKQCHSSTGQCWCVDENGQEINGTRNKPGEETTNCVSCAMRQANSKPVPGAFVPSCKADGSYEERQCHTSTGFCWCVNEDGKELVGTKKGPGEGEPDCSVQLSCAEQLAANTKPVPGAYEPTCKDDGSFTEKQCHGSSGYCWCVTPDGKEINGTKRAPGEGAVICGTCAMRRDNAKSMPGAFAPTCKDDGSYEKMQCDGSTGHCWCVNEDGKELVGTRKGPTEGKPHCESCAMRRANSKPMPGEFVPTCKDDGSYEEKQCHPSTGSCWCVSPDGKQITGTEKGPTEGEPICSDPCTQPPLTGKCRGYFVRYHYNQKSKSCEEFVYGGCGANRNNFETVEACNKACGKKTA